MFLTLILWLLLFAVAVAIALFFVPLQVWVIAAAKPELSYRCDIRVFFGLAPRVTLVSDADRRSAPAGEETKKAAKRRMPDARLIHALPGLLSEVIRRIHLVSLRIDCEFGLEDPSDTGRLAGLLLPVAYAGPGSGTSEIALRPNFERPCLEGEIAAVFHLTPAHFVPPIARFAWRSFGPRQ